MACRISEDLDHNFRNSENAGSIIQNISSERVQTRSTNAPRVAGRLAEQPWAIWGTSLDNCSALSRRSNFGSKIGRKPSVERFSGPWKFHPDVCFNRFRPRSGPQRGRKRLKTLALAVKCKSSCSGLSPSHLTGPGLTGPSLAWPGDMV